MSHSSLPNQSARIDASDPKNIPSFGASKVRPCQNGEAVRLANVSHRLRVVELACPVKESQQ